VILLIKRSWRQAPCTLNRAFFGRLIKTTCLESHLVATNLAEFELLRSNLSGLGVEIALSTPREGSTAVLYRFRSEREKIELAIAR
jgi:hypothetical protein